MQAAESGLRRLGCVKVNLQVRMENAPVIDLYLGLGYRIEQRTSLGKRLDVDL